MKKLLIILVAVFLLTGNLQSQTVYITKTGNKYHTGGCGYLSRSKFAIELSEALARDYGSCSVCRPPSILGTGKSKPATTSVDESGPANNKSKTSRSVQCGGFTSSGSRCKNSTSSSNGYCALHGGN